jgi:glycosyltransferase involved in cell wall biosynthesis
VVAKVFGKRCIVKVAGAGRFGDLEVLSGFLGFRWALSILKRADRMIAISSDVEKELLEWGFSPQKIERIPNGVDIAFFTRKQTFPPPAPVRFILVGRRSPQKGIDIALQAAQSLLKNGLKQAFEIKFYGADHSTDDYRRMAEAWGVDAHVEFLPYQDDIRDVLHSAHALILPSRSEGMPNVVLESMSFELPVIASRVSGVVDIIDDGVDGILIPVEDPQALAQAMKSIIMDPELGVRLGQRARQKIVSEFSLERVVDRYSDLYEKLCGGR